MDITFDHYDAIINELRGKGIDLHLRTETILKRKFEKFFAIKNLKNIDQFYQNTSSGDFLTELSNFIITDKTEIFRFPDSWNFIRSYAEMKGANHNFSIFIPNCASGEDIISFAIMFDRLGFKNWHIHADTETEEKLIRSKKLYFEESKLDLCSHNFGVMFDKNLFQQYFTLRDRNYYFNLKIDEHLTLSTDTIDRRNNNKTFEIVYAANILNLYKPEGCRNIISSLYNATAMNGYLVLGNLESIPNGFYNNMFDRADQKYPIYIKLK